MKEILPIGKATEDAILDAAGYLNNHRALADVEDGCKPSYRRMIWAALQFPKGELQPSVQLINRMASYHPHSLDGCTGLLASMVRSGIMTGKGSFGFTSILGDEKPAAAPRYTKTRLSDLWYNSISPLMQCIEKVESPVGPLECKKIGVVFPLCLSFRGLVAGIGFGISTVYPNFSPKSLYLAYKNNNPNLLEPNINILIDKKNSELDKLWTKGKGRVIYSYKVSPYTSEDGKKGFLFEGDTDIFTPNLKKIYKLVEAGHVFVEDMTDAKGPKLFIGLVSGRGITLQDLEKLCRQCCWDGTTYQLNVTSGETCFRIPLQSWLDYTYKNYIKLLNDVTAKKMEKLKFDLEVQLAIPKIAEIILNNPKVTDKEIIDKTGYSKEIIGEVLKKPLSLLRKKDTSEKIKELKEKINELKKFDPEEYTKNLVEKL